jgi:hypothetical protein
MHLDDPVKDINKIEIHHDQMAEMCMDYLVPISKAATSMKEETFWGPINLIAQHLPQNHIIIQTLLDMVIILSQNGCIYKLYNHFI